LLILFSLGTIFELVYVTYNNNFTEGPAEQNLNSATVFVWRILYFYFIPVSTHWNDFIEGIIRAPGLFESMNFTKVGLLIRAYLQQQKNNDFKKLHLVVGIDEFQLLFDRQFDDARRLSIRKCRERIIEIVMHR
jgi:hypothetical protein